MSDKVVQSVFVGEFFKANAALKEGKAIKRIGWNGFWKNNANGELNVISSEVKSVTAAYLLDNATANDWMICGDEYVEKFTEMYNDSVKYNQLKQMQIEAAKKAEAEKKLAEDRAAQVAPAQIPVAQQKPVKTSKKRK